MKARLIGLPVIGLVVLCCVGVHAQQTAPIEPAGYRMGDYRSATPKTLQGASVLTTKQAESLWRSGGAIFVDVLPGRPDQPISRSEPCGATGRV